MSSIESSRIRRNALQANAEDDQPEDRSFGRRTSSTGLRKIIRILMLLLIVLLVLNRNLNQILAADQERLEQGREEYQVEERGRASPMNPKIKTDEGEFNYLALNMIWPVTVYAKILRGLSHSVYCSAASCQEKLINYVATHGYRFTIHGLWPSNTELALGHGPRNCNPYQKNERGARVRIGFSRKIRSIEEIRKYWPSFLGSEETRNPASHNELLGFWEIQWNRHGVCAAKIDYIMRSCVQYFSKTVELARSLDGVQQELVARWLGYGNEPTIEQLIDFFENKTGPYGYSVQINHEKKMEPKDKYVNKNWLESISFCFDLKLRPTDCKITVHPYKHEVLLPELKSLLEIKIAEQERPPPDPSDDPRFQ